ncbi:uncharacterized protein EHS24_009388 [Apiotrichum porosum]|uniref:Zn(2)-C6 fungal-type domain-containing protein n=1 Tax=Apiotrichum porosum TaxID=105984 RepID=A0A427XLW0_9TREE|nr:uncharacterized protein EHS24_009388 [Apiotrichum porosum]RSH79734.1 hypothetical protein EHS24_009388 [Apiotrichum porosum]
MPDSQERTRTTKACVACSIRKIKCDGSKPCAHCVRFFSGECFYTTAKKRGPPKGCPARGGHRKRQAIAAENAANANAAAGVAVAQVVGTSSGSSHAAAHMDMDMRSVHQGALSQPARGLLLKESPDQQPSQFHPKSSPNTSVFDEVLLNNLGIPSGIPSTDLSFGVTDTDSMFRSPQTDTTTAQSPIAPYLPPRRRNTAPSVWSPPNLIMPSSPNVSMPSQAARAGLSSQTIDELLTVFETFIHPHWPVIYVPALRSLRQLETQCPLVFDAILAVSAANADFEPEEGSITLTDSANAAQLSTACDYLCESVRQRIMAHLTINTHPDRKPSLQTVQALIFVALVDLGCGRKPLSYQMVGFACRMAVDIGLHTRRTSSAPHPRDSREIQERSRTIWSCYLIDKMTAAVSQRPPCLRLIDIDAPRPSTMERDELDLWLSGKPYMLLAEASHDTMVCMKSHTLSSFNAWIDVMALMELILDQVYRPSTRHARMDGHQVEGYDEAVMHIDAELRKWRSTLPHHLQWSDDDDNAHRNVGLHMLTCRGWYYICILLLHRPQVPYLDSNEDSADVDASEALMGLSEPFHSDMSSYRVPRALDASRHAATSICKIMESYETTFRVRKFASSWVYLAFQAGTVHAGLAAHVPSASLASGLSPSRAESLRHLEQCIGWLSQIAHQWSSASRHVEILRKLSAVGARTRPPSPSRGTEASGSEGAAFLPTMDRFEPNDNGSGSLPGGLTAMDLDAWMLLWASMPTAGDDITLWQQCFPNMT